MAYVKEIGTGVATLACAVGIGFIMQSSDTAQSRYAGAAAVPAPAPTLPDPANADGPILDVGDLELTSASGEAPAPEAEAEAAPEIIPAAAEPEAAPPKVDDRAPLPPADCAITMDAEALPNGYVQLSMEAPCHEAERFTLHHSGMMITQTTAGSGGWSARVPALSENAVFIAAFADGEGAVAQIAVPDLAGVDRIVLQWQGRSGFELHAREFGADYGSDRHRFHGRRGTVAAFDAGSTGRMERFGSEGAQDARMADVYTFPRGGSAQAGTIDLSVEAEVTVYNCGLEIAAQSLELRDGTIRTQDLTLAVSPCDTIGSFLVLNNLVQDLKVAAK
ncbi:MAG: hypothetical protein AAGF60_01645 [Pseudomonadota bacterium]